MATCVLATQKSAVIHPLHATCKACGARSGATAADGATESAQHTPRTNYHGIHTFLHLYIPLPFIEDDSRQLGIAFGRSLGGRNRRVHFTPLRSLPTISFYNIARFIESRPLYNTQPLETRTYYLAMHCMMLHVDFHICIEYEHITSSLSTSLSGRRFFSTVKRKNEHIVTVLPQHALGAVLDRFASTVHDLVHLDTTTSTSCHAHRSPIYPIPTHQAPCPCYQARTLSRALKAYA